MPGEERLVAVRQTAIETSTRPVGNDVAIGPVVSYSFTRFAVPVFQGMLLALSYYLAARLGLGFRFQNSQIGVVWPANAVLLSALVLAPPCRRWIVIVVTALAHTAAVGSSIPVWRLFWQMLAAVIRERDEVERALQTQRNQLAQVSRARTVSELSGALAHELNQPLTAILANAQAGIRFIARQQPADLRLIREILEDIAKQDRQAASVIARLRSLLKEEEPRFEPLDLENVVQEALSLGHRTMENSGVHLEAQIAAGLPCVQGDRVQLLQVLTNLILNACESMNDVAASDRCMRLRALQVDPQRVDVSVEDSGSGLPRGSEGRVFEPFFTTKPQGLGLGLAICRSIATAHGGELWAENGSERGATFHLVLPTDCRPLISPPPHASAQRVRP